MGQYRLHNEIQCQKLCWYRQLCSSYSFHHTSVHWSSEDPNCLLHAASAQAPIVNTATTSTTTATTTTTTTLTTWTEHRASNSTVLNACSSRPCDALSVCVPHYPLSPSPSSPSSFLCLPLPAQCGPPPPVPHGNVQGAGTQQQGDTARVVCNTSFVASPRNVAVDLTCQVTSEWTPFLGQCLQYEFRDSGLTAVQSVLPWSFQHSPVVCIKGVFIPNNQVYVNLKPDELSKNMDLHFFIRDMTLKGVFWNTKINGRFQQRHQLGSLPFTPGHPFSLVLRLKPDSLAATVNTHHVYNVPLKGPGVLTGIDVSTSKFIAVGGPSGNISYINTVSGC